MKTGYLIKFRRRREGKTDYKHRYKLLLSRKPRLVIRKTNTRVITHIVDYNREGDRTLFYASSEQLRALGWKHSCKSIPASYLIGYLIGLEAKEKGIKELVLDIGLCKHHKKGRIYAALKGVLDAGISVPHNEEILPPEDRIKGKHIKLEKDFEILKKKIEESKSTKKAGTKTSSKPKTKTAAKKSAAKKSEA